MVEAAEEDPKAPSHCRRVAALALEIGRMAHPPAPMAGLLNLCTMVDEQLEALQFEYKDCDTIFDEIQSFAPFEGFDPAWVGHLRHLHWKLPENVRRGEGLPVEAQAARQVFLTLGQDRDYDVWELAAVAVRDPVLAASVIRVANSSLYSPSGKLTAASQAIVYIGTTQARKVMLAAALLPLFASAGLLRQWTHAVGMAQFCSALATKTECVGAEDALVLGLIHDFGSLAVQFAPRETRDTYARLLERGCPPVYVERLLFGCDHGEIGAEILSHWNFADAVVEAVRFHHQPERSPQDLTAFIYLAEFWSGLDEDIPSFHRVEACLARTGLSLEDLAHTAPQDNSLKTLRSLA